MQRHPVRHRISVTANFLQCFVHIIRNAGASVVIVAIASPVGEPYFLVCFLNIFVLCECVLRVASLAKQPKVRRADDVSNNLFIEARHIPSALFRCNVNLPRRTVARCPCVGRTVNASHILNGQKL